MENITLLVALSQMAQGLTHIADNAKQPATQERVAPLLAAIKAEIASLSTAL